MGNARPPDIRRGASRCYCQHVPGFALRGRVQIVHASARQAEHPTARARCKSLLVLADLRMKEIYADLAAGSAVGTPPRSATSREASPCSPRREPAPLFDVLILPLPVKPVDQN